MSYKSLGLPSLSLFVSQSVPNKVFCTLHSADTHLVDISI